MTLSASHLIVQEFEPTCLSHWLSLCPTALSVRGLDFLVTATPWFFDFSATVLQSCCCSARCVAWPSLGQAFRCWTDGFTFDSTILWVKHELLCIPVAAISCHYPSNTVLSVAMRCLFSYAMLDFQQTWFCASWANISLSYIYILTR